MTRFFRFLRRLLFHPKPKPIPATAVLKCYAWDGLVDAQVIAFSDGKTHYLGNGNAIRAALAQIQSNLPRPVSPGPILWVDPSRESARQRFERILTPHLSSHAGPATLALMLDQLSSVFDRQAQRHRQTLALLMLKTPRGHRTLYEAGCAPLERVPTTGLMVFGNPQPKPIKTNLRGRIRLRLRAGEWGAAFVRTKDGTRRFHLVAFADHWELALEHGANVRYRPQ